MKPLTLNTTPSFKELYAIKHFEGPNFPLPYHKHDRYELTCIVAGSGIRIIGDNIGEYNSGDVVLLAPQLAHQWQSDSNHKGNVSAISVFFSEEFPSTDFQQLSEFRPICHAKKLSKKGMLLQDRLSIDVARQITNLYHLTAFDQILHLLHTLHTIGTSSSYELLSTNEPAVIKPSGNERMELITQFIFQHFNKKISLNAIADVACMHPGSVGRFFKQSAGFSLIEYINLVRIGKVCELLNETDKSISTIAMDCGFENLSYFNRCFKRIKGQTPQEYRSKMDLA